uniref:Uncharacterized protein n=1 Tax=Scleropages formosus TaxID=113540 RepID=A0A8C9RWL7_SCLFO
MSLSRSDFRKLGIVCSWSNDRHREKDNATCQRRPQINAINSGEDLNCLCTPPNCYLHQSVHSTRFLHQYPGNRTSSLNEFSDIFYECILSNTNLSRLKLELLYIQMYIQKLSRTTHTHTDKRARMHTV